MLIYQPIAERGNAILPNTHARLSPETPCLSHRRFCGTKTETEAELGAKRRHLCASQLTLASPPVNAELTHAG